MLHVLMSPHIGPVKTKLTVASATSPELRWGGPTLAGWVLTADRFQRLTRVSENETLYETEDVVEGCMARVTVALCGGAVQAGFNAATAALKQRAEALAAAGAAAGADGLRNR
jgi:hypothetical protein